MPATWIVVPCFNEAARLDVAAFRAFAAGHPEIGFIFVDDGSTDATWQVLEGLRGASGGTIATVRLPGNRGKGGAIQAGLRAAIARGAEVVGYFDADLATPLEELARLIAVRDGRDVDVVLGARVSLLGHDIRRSPSRHYLGRAFATLASALLELPIYDSQCGAKVFRVTPALRGAIEAPFVTRWLFDIELLARLRLADDRVTLEEVPLRRWADIKGSKLHLGSVTQIAADLHRVFRTRQRDRTARRSRLDTTVSYSGRDVDEQQARSAAPR